MNYLATAQTVAISKALSLWGYSADKEGDAEPDGIKNIAPEDSAPDITSMSPPINISRNGMSVEQARATVMYNAPFAGKTIGQILDFNDPDEIIALRDQLRMETDMQTARAEVAEVILPLIS